MRLTEFAFLLALSLLSVSLKADEDDEAKEHKESSESYSEKEGFKIGEKAQKTLGVTFLEVHGVGPVFDLPVKSLVYHQDEIGIYRFREGRFKLVDVDLLSKGKDKTSIKCAELHPEDQVVVEGAALVRVADLAAKSGIEGEGL